MERVLVVEDDLSIRESLSTALDLEGFDVRAVPSAESALELLDSEIPDIALLDVRLPGRDGFSLCRSIREAGHRFPIIMLTAKDQEIDKVLGLEMGADDYMVKPYSFRELLSRIRAQLRRSAEYSAQPPSRADELQFGHVRIDFTSFTAFRDGRPLELTPIEMKIMRAFQLHPGQSLSRGQIINQVWGENYYLEDPRTVDVHVRHLREKLEVNPSEPDHILTVRSIGYRFVKNP
jgi:DNA-binding response OmpR family regulator